MPLKAITCSWKDNILTSCLLHLSSLLVRRKLFTFALQETRDQSSSHLFSSEPRRALSMERSGNICIIYSAALLSFVLIKTRQSHFKVDICSRVSFNTGQKNPKHSQQINVPYCIGFLMSSIASSLIHDLVTQIYHQHEFYQAVYPVSTPSFSLRIFHSLCAPQGSLTINSHVSMQY